MNNDLHIKSMALDLKRVVQAQISGSERMANRFIEEALKHKNQIDYSVLTDEMKNVLNRLDVVLTQKDEKRLSDDALMYSSILIQLSK